MSMHAYVVNRKIWLELKQWTFQLPEVAERRLTHDHQNADMSFVVTVPVMACFLVTIMKLSPL